LVRATQEGILLYIAIFNTLSIFYRDSFGKKGVGKKGVGKKGVGKKGVGKKGVGKRICSPWV